MEKNLVRYAHHPAINAKLLVGGGQKLRLGKLHKALQKLAFVEGVGEWRWIKMMKETWSPFLITYVFCFVFYSSVSGKKEREKERKKVVNVPPYYPINVKKELKEK